MESLRFKPGELQIDNDAPFKNDLLARKESAEVLTDFVSSLAEPFVMAIDSPFGTGKTTFLKMWREHLRQHDLHSLYFNAWQSDFSDSPLVALIGELDAGIKSLRPTNLNPKVAETLEKAKRIGAGLAKRALPAVVKIVTAGIVDVPAIEGELAELAEDLAKERIERYEEDKHSIADFREQLTKLVQELNEGRSPRPLVFMIDELDRCRPDFAVELLEKLKHLFSIDGLVFVLALDKQQCGSMLKTLYGQDLDVNGYLRKLIDLEYRLPDPDYRYFALAQLHRFGFEKFLPPRADGIGVEQWFPDLFCLFRLSLRTQERCLTQLMVFVRTVSSRRQEVHAPLLSLLICLRAENKDVYDDYCNGKKDPRHVVALLKSLPGAADFNREFFWILEAYLVRGWPSEFRNPRLEELLQTARTQADGAAVEMAKRIYTVARNLPEDMTEFLHKRLELTQRFLPVG